MMLGRSLKVGRGRGDDSGGVRAQLCHPINRRREGRPLYRTEKSTVAAGGEGRMPASNKERGFMPVHTVMRRLILASRGSEVKWMAGAPDSHDRPSVLLSAIDTIVTGYQTTWKR